MDSTQPTPHTGGPCPVAQMQLLLCSLTDLSVYAVVGVVNDTISVHASHVLWLNMFICWLCRGCCIDA